MRTLTATILVLATAACGKPAPPSEAPGAGTNTANAAAVATPGAPASPPALPTPAAQASMVKETAGDYSFAYAYPAAAAAIPALAGWLNADRDRIRAQLASDSAGFRREANAGGFPFHAYESTTTWKVVTATPRLLSLSADTYDYFGGAHGSPGFRSIVWDNRAGQRLNPTDMFASPAAIEAALRDAFCAALDRRRQARRGAAVVRSADSFNACPKVAQATMILGSTDRRAIDRIGLLVPPYVAGSFAEGSYDLTLPVTPAVIAALKPAYRSAFALRR